MEFSFNKEPDPLAKLNEKIRLIEQQIKQFESDLNPIKNKRFENERYEREKFDEFQELVRKLRAERSELQFQEQHINLSLQELARELQNLNNLHGLEMQRLAAQQKLDELRSEFDLLRMDRPWSDPIKQFQWDDVCTMLSVWKFGRTGILNANAMGLGKTLEATVFLDVVKHLFYERENRLPSVLWLTKKSLVMSSFKEIRRWNPDQLIIPMKGTLEDRNLQIDIAVANNAMLMTNYDALNTTPKLKSIAWDFVIADEVHKLKGGANPTPTKVFENMKEVCERTQFFVPLSGSPIQNHPKEMWPYLHLFDRERFPSARRFESEYCFGYPQINVDWERIITILKDRVIRRRKEEVLTELPPKTYDYRYVQLEGEQKAIYDQLRDEFFYWLDKEAGKALSMTSILAQLIRLRQVNVIPSSIVVSGERIVCTQSAKLDEAMELIEQIVNENEQVVVWSSQFNEPVYELGRRIQREMPDIPVGVITGDTVNATDIEQQFQDGKVKVLLCNMKSASEGFNFQKNPSQWSGGASHAIFLDLWWNPEAMNQAEDRIHREGQTDPVEIHYILTGDDSGTVTNIDAFMMDKLETKKAMIAGIMGSDEIKSGSEWKDYLGGLL